jgi:hypothetical protein
MGERLFRDQVGPPTKGERFIHSGWWQQREQVIHSLFRTMQSECRLKAFLACGRSSWIEQNNADPNRFRLRCNHCHDRMCQPCAAARAFRVRTYLMRHIAGRRCRFVTLTLCGRKGDKLVDLVDRLYKHFRALRLHPTWADNVDGGAAFLEIKYSAKARRWHPHLHIICEGKFLPQGELSTAWRSITKDSFIVDVRDARDEAVAHYVAKYASKPLNPSFGHNADLLDEAVIALKGRRLCLCFGTWYGTPLQHAEDEELADDEDDAAGWHIFNDLEAAIAAAEAGDDVAMNAIRSVPSAYERFVRFSAQDP